MAGAVAVVMLVWFVPGGAPPPSRGLAMSEVLQTTRDTVLTLDDASTVELGAGSRVARTDPGPAAAPDDVSIRLEAGQARFEVQPREHGTFVVRAGSVEVRVVGTRFTVRRLGADGAEVDVEEGVVEVRAPGVAMRTLRAGERWSSGARPAARPAAAGPAPAESIAPAPSAASPSAPPASPDDGPDPSRGGPSANVSSRPVAPRARAETRRRPGAKSTQVGPIAGPVAGGARSRTVHGERRPPTSRAATLLAEASEARRAKDFRQAARLLQRLVDAYPGDVRAGLAAFELGKLRMDRFGDWEGALEAFRRSLRSSGASAFRTDAMARMVILSGRLKRDDCPSLRDAYLEAHPSGRRRSEVAAACP
jgi:TolA-binding protein